MEKYPKKERLKEEPYSLKITSELEELMSDAKARGYDVPKMARKSLIEAFTKLRQQATEDSEDKAS